MSEDKDFSQLTLASVKELLPRGVYTHRKGGEYVLHGYSVDEASLKILVHYYSLKKKSWWTREAPVFTEPVDGKPRFWFLRLATGRELSEACGFTVDSPEDRLWVEILLRDTSVPKDDAEARSAMIASGYPDRIISSYLEARKNAS